jgi:hypothetical protein
MNASSQRQVVQSKNTLPRDRIESLDWVRITDDLNAFGNAVLPALLNLSECQSIVIITAMRPEIARFSGRRLQASGMWSFAL